MRPTYYGMTGGTRARLVRVAISSVILSIMLASKPVHAQNLPDFGAPTSSGILPPVTTPGSPVPPQGRAQRRSSILSQTAGPPTPEFQLGASVNFSESYVTNTAGVPGASSADYLSSLGGTINLHEHSRRLSLDANYSGEADFYAKGTLPTQISNNLQAVANIDVISNYLTLGAKAFAQPVVVSNVGIITSDNRVVPNGFQNSYGYYVSPDLRFNLDDFAISETLPSFGQAFFTSPPGSLNISPIPGVSGPQDTTSRSLTERISSGTYFDRFNWNIVGSDSETARSQSLLTEKAGIANLRYALNDELSLLATGGYDAISNSTSLNQNVSGPVALGGFALTFGKEFMLQVEGGQKYNRPSILGSLRYNLTSRAVITASVDDTVQTPEGQLLSNLTNLTARPDGSLGLAQDVLGNGSPSSLSTFTIQSQGNLSFDQNISRYQTANFSFAEDFARDHALVGLYGSRRTILGGVFVGPAVQDSLGTQVQFGHDLTPLLRATIGGSYFITDELGGQARTLQVQGQLNYNLSSQTSVYASVQYLQRSSSASLQALSQLTGSLSDVRATIGLSHTL